MNLSKDAFGAGDHIEVEVLVIGSGAGGAPTAALLAEAGFDVLIVEEGEWYDQGSIKPFSLDQMQKQYRSGGVTVALGRPSIAYTEGRCAGGGTEVNSGLYKRPPHSMLTKWRDGYMIQDLELDDIDAIADEIETDLSISYVPGESTLASKALARGATKLGWRNSEIPRWMAYPEQGDALSGKRQSMTETYLPRAINAGAILSTGIRVERLDMTDATAGAAIVERRDGRAGRISFRHVFVCCGAIHTPALLQRSGIKGNIGKSLAVHPTVKLSAKFSEAINVDNDVPVHQVTEFFPHSSFGGSASQAGLLALALNDNWREFRGQITDWRRMSVYYAAITSEGRGRVISVPGMRDPIVTYRLTKNDRTLLGVSLGRLALAMLAAGAEAVYPSFRGAPVVKRPADVARLEAGFSATKASVMSVHLCSTVPMGEDPRRCGADSFGRVHGTTNVRVNDASLLPSAPGVNPQATVMALVVRNVRRFIEETVHA
ncbi:MAG: GMC family oxidoreductase [Actinobacteria bacterium]|uniref:Unannotated protein n=1 Tax=freshwater metagenome TaxID=449393 RepID=A0A6J7NMW6_9ZZZZ|nr:GMC family oxidoreductase [Actinomycetota bacterium]